MASFRDVAELAGSHHERLDGCGYHRGLAADDLSIEARVIKIADIYQALSVDRPYRAALSWDEIDALVRPDLGTSVCADAFAALRTYVGANPVTPQESAATGFRVA